MGAPGEQVTGLETPPGGDARQVPWTLVRRLDELCHLLLNLVFPSTTVPINNKLSCFCRVKKKSERVGLSVGGSIQVHPPQYSKSSGLYKYRLLYSLPSSDDTYRKQIFPYVRRITTRPAVPNYNTFHSCR